LAELITTTSQTTAMDLSLILKSAAFYTVSTKVSRFFHYNFKSSQQISIKFAHSITKKNP